MKTDASVGTWS